MVVPLKIIAASLIAGILAINTGYVITARVFHAYQSRTPNTWRATESWTHYLYSSGIRLLSCFAIVVLYALIGSRFPTLLDSQLLRGAAFGTCLWAAVAAPVILEAALFVNWHRGFVVGLLLDWLVLCAIAGMAASVVTSAF
jgi:hypothetical protein